MKRLDIHRKYDPNKHGPWVRQCPACPEHPTDGPAKIQGGLPGLAEHYRIVHPDRTPPPEETP